MRFWDSSAIVPLVIEEPTSKACRALLRADPVMIAWCFTRTEVLSAIHREARAGRLGSKAVQVAETRIGKLSERWWEIDAIADAREIAEELLRKHPLRCADSLQLAAALVAFAQHPRGRFFVVRDALLAEAAEREGFSVLVPR